MAKVEYVTLPSSWPGTLEGIWTVADVAFVLAHRAYDLKENTQVEFNGVLLRVPFEPETPIELATARAVTHWWESVLAEKNLS